jgi:hypothetical protein
MRSMALEDLRTFEFTWGLLFQADLFYRKYQCARPFTHVQPVLELDPPRRSNIFKVEVEPNVPEDL